MSSEQKNDSDPKEPDFKKLELGFKDYLQREERGELTEEECAMLNSVAEERGQPLHDFLWCMWHLASEIVKQRAREAVLSKVPKEDTNTKRPNNTEADLIANDTDHPGKKYWLTDQELNELTSTPEGQFVPLFRKMWLERYRASKQAQQKSRMVDKEPKKQEAESVIGSIDEIEIMQKAAEKCGQTLPVYLASLLVSTLGISDQKLMADVRIQNAQLKAKPKKRMAVTLKDAAQICDRSPSAIKKWERGENTPEGWPGRGDLMVLKAFANTREGRSNLKKAIKNAARFGDMDKISQHVAR